MRLLRHSLSTNVIIDRMNSHLPDLTAITPCFDENDPSKIIFFTASRGRESSCISNCLRLTRFSDHRLVVLSHIVAKDSALTFAVILEAFFLAVCLLPRQTSMKKEQTFCP